MDDIGFMRQAMGLARLGAPAPNPHVGAVVVQHSVVVGEGYHERAGAAHAEAAALASAGGASDWAPLRDATSGFHGNSTRPS